MAEERLSPADAMAAIARAAAFDEPLRRRVEGMTWMVWGFATAGVTLASNATELVWGFPGPRGSWLVPWAWLLAAVAATTALWRIAALARPAAHPGRRAAAIAIALVVGLITVVWLAVALAVPLQYQAALVLVTVAIPWLALAALNPHRVSPLGRRVMAAIGAALLLAAVAWAPLAAALPHEAAFPQTLLVAALAGGGAPLVAGFWQAMRG